MEENREFENNELENKSKKSIKFEINIDQWS